ncbi:MAG TPA: beta-propeller fold lactonase family protein [Acidimicrobiales bacterium]|nr:beta-propeller fold lactonase family protein [Acidimicrobiales bacterium]
MNHRLTRLAAAGALVAGVALSATAAASSAGADVSPTHAVFALTDATSNSVLSFARASDGSLSAFGSFSTGGVGLSAAGAAADPLASQGGLTLAGGGRVLLAVNSGSDTVSVFGVDGASLTLLGQVGSDGNFPVSIASHGNLVAVLNAGGAGSVAEFTLNGTTLSPLAGEVRSLGLSNSSPPYFLAGAGQVGYSPDGRFLVATTKASSSSFEVFAVHGDGTLSTDATVTSAAHAVPFAFTWGASDQLVAVEASTSSLSVYSLDSTGALTLTGTVSDGAAALCWVSAARGYYFGDNAGSHTVSSFSVSPGGVPTLDQATAGTAYAGTTDSAASPDGHYLYVESGGSGKLSVFSVSADGSLTWDQTISGLPVPYEGIAVS